MQLPLWCTEDTPLHPFLCLLEGAPLRGRRVLPRILQSILRPHGQTVSWETVRNVHRNLSLTCARWRLCEMCERNVQC